MRGIYNLRPPYWSEQEDKLLADLWRDGLSAGLIAEQFHNRSRCSVISRARRIGLPSREPVVVRKAPPPPPRVVFVPATVRRDPCMKCGVRGDIGCQHREAA